MQTCATRTAAEIPPDHRSWVEGVVGHSLHPSERVVFLSYVPGAVPSADVQGQAVRRIEELAQIAAQHQAAQGVSEQEIDAAVDEAVEHARKRRRQR
jgi:hypothetical protein